MTTRIAPHTYTLPRSSTRPKIRSPLDPSRFYSTNQHTQLSSTTRTRTKSTAVFQQKKDEAGGTGGQEPVKRRKVAEAKIKVARAAAKQVGAAISGGGGID